MNSRVARELRFAAGQLALWAGLYGAYLFARSLVIDRSAPPTPTLWS